jgi:phage terminase small subunit
MHMTLQKAKHEFFAQHFVANGNAAEAARAIGYSRHAAQRGSDLLRRPDVAARVQEIMAGRPTIPARLALRLESDIIKQMAAVVAAFASLK